MRALAKAHQRLGERPVRMHRNMAGDIVEDVRFGKIVEGGAVADRDRGGKLAVAQAVEEEKGRDVSAHRLRLEPVSGFRNRFTSSSRGSGGIRQRLSIPWRKCSLAYRCQRSYMRENSLRQASWLASE